MCLEHVRRTIQLLLIIAGILVSLYAYHVETSKEANAAYQAFCDISDSISCSKVFTSKWGRGMGLLEDFIGRDHILNQPNSVVGIIVYAIIFVLEMMSGYGAVKAEMIVCFISNLVSVWLGYILFFVLEDVCVVCITIYAINFSLLVGSIDRYKHFKSNLARKTK